MNAYAVLALIADLVGAEPGSTRFARIAAVAPVLAGEAVRVAVNPLLVAAVMNRESAFHPGARGRLGEIGLMQIMPGTGRKVCPDLVPFLWEPWANIRCGIRVLVQAEQRCGGPPRNWLGRYNGRGCGPSVYANRVLTVGHSPNSGRRGQASRFVTPAREQLAQQQGRPAERIGRWSARATSTER